MPKPSPSELTPAQLEIMDLVWGEPGGCTISFLWSRLKARRPVARNTVLTLVQRLEQRGFLSREAIGRSHVYRSRVTREETRKQRLRDVLDHSFSGSPEDLVRSLLGDESVGPEEIRSLRRLLEEREKQLDPPDRNGEAS